MKKSILLIFCLFTCIASFAQVDKEYKSTLKKMIEVSGSSAAFKGAITQIMVMFKQNYTNVPSNVWDEFEKEFSKTSVDDLVELLAPIYYKHLTVGDLKKIIEFYQTPVGKKYAEETPMITQESMAAGQEWGMKIGQQVQEKLKEKGYSK
jgi:hypothetical protein